MSKAAKEFLFGASPVLAALRANRRRLIKLHVLHQQEQSSESSNTNSRKSEAIRLATALNLKIGNSKSAVSLANLALAPHDSFVHNGLVLECGLLPIQSIRGLTFPEIISPLLLSYSAIVTDKEHINFDFTPSSPRQPHSPEISENILQTHRPPLWLALDNLTDPQNLGAIIRTCRFFSVDGIVATSSSPITTASCSKASAGAVESFETLYTTRSLPAFLAESRANGWSVYGTDLAAQQRRGAVVMNCWDRRRVQEVHENGVRKPVLLVMGSEGSGIGKAVSNQCDAHLVIPSGFGANADGGVDNDGGLDSLNVSVATGILISSLQRDYL
ncbi:hypothetical protein HK100_004492 [Physocladia obscura]|uniref:tRNA/rRNA methyltransferase SpoU type domain-containing protein n=1 Tax=Physocladia obscura TaxID=109957 RepID=A0AAD5XDU4_9FUNG|nr:hypothetical protein HK100_004492 [Physocladia obscura]